MTRTGGAGRWTLAVHGGAGAIERARLTPEREAACRATLEASLRAGAGVLGSGGSALDAVEQAVRSLEAAEEFNAGRGSVLTADGRIEMDAAIADGRGRRAGAVGALRRIAHPVSAARAVLDDGAHVLLVAEGAEAFARRAGLRGVEESELRTSARVAQLERARGRDQVAVDHDEEFRGTVGAVARDAGGHLAAATSTGGLTNQRPGRVGDTPLPGAGTWADDATCAVSATGHGESLIRAAVAHEVDAGVRLAGLDLGTACERALARALAHGGRGGCIAVGVAGPAVLRFSSTGMFRGWIGPMSGPRVAIY